MPTRKYRKNTFRKNRKRKLTRRKYNKKKRVTRRRRMYGGGWRSKKKKRAFAAAKKRQARGEALKTRNTNAITETPVSSPAGTAEFKAPEGHVPPTEEEVAAALEIFKDDLAKFDMRMLPRKASSYDNQTPRSAGD